MNDDAHGDPIDREWLELKSKALAQELESRDMDKATELMMVGWVAEPLRNPMPVMSWYWRRPPRGKRKKGRLFLSTDQAYSAMKIEKGEHHA